jgi:hypothetical protein
LEVYVGQEHKYIKPGSLDENGWNLAGKKEQRLLHKLQKAGVPLGEYINGNIYRGVLTGLNEAFVIDESTRQRLIREDKRSKEVIKPFLTGKDIKRYQKPESRNYLIFTRRGINIDE